MFQTGERLVRARIHLVASADGGRSDPIVGGSSFRPNHNFFGPENSEMAVGLIDLQAGERMEPGETRILEITFVTWPASELYPGREWTIQEGARIIGAGHVLEIVDPATGHPAP